MELAAIATQKTHRVTNDYLFGTNEGIKKGAEAPLNFVNIDAMPSSCSTLLASPTSGCLRSHLSHLVR